MFSTMKRGSEIKMGNTNKISKMALSFGPKKKLSLNMALTTNGINTPNPVGRGIEKVILPKGVKMIKTKSKKISPS